MPKTILVVDDDPNIRDTAKDILEDAGYAVETGETCESALQRLRSVPIDVAIIDFNLPDGRGIELAMEAKTIRPTLKMLLMTGEAHVDLGPAAAIIYSTLTKPVNPAELINILRKIVDS